LYLKIKLVPRSKYTCCRL